METVLISIIGSLIVVLLGWIVYRMRTVDQRVEDKCEKLSARLEEKVDKMNDKLGSKANISDIDKCRTDCHKEQKSIWERVNIHRHTTDTGEVVLPR